MQTSVLELCLVGRKDVNMKRADGKQSSTTSLNSKVEQRSVTFLTLGEGVLTAPP